MFGTKFCGARGLSTPVQARTDHIAQTSMRAQTRRLLEVSLRSEAPPDVPRRASAATIAFPRCRRHWPPTAAAGDDPTGRPASPSSLVSPAAVAAAPPPFRRPAPNAASSSASKQARVAGSVTGHVVAAARGGNRRPEAAAIHGPTTANRPQSPSLSVTVTVCSAVTSPPTEQHVQGLGRYPARRGVPVSGCSAAAPVEPMAWPAGGVPADRDHIARHRMSGTAASSTNERAEHPLPHRPNGSCGSRAIR